MRHNADQYWRIDAKNYERASDRKWSYGQLEKEYTTTQAISTFARNAEQKDIEQARESDKGIVDNKQSEPTEN